MTRLAALLVALIALAAMGVAVVKPLTASLVADAVSTPNAITLEASRSTVDYPVILNKRRPHTRGAGADTVRRIAPKAQVQKNLVNRSVTTTPGNSTFVSRKLSAAAPTPRSRTSAPPAATDTPKVGRRAKPKSKPKLHGGTSSSPDSGLAGDAAGAIVAGGTSEVIGSASGR